MGFTSIVWDLDDDPEGNVQHVAEHGITKEEVEQILERPAGIESLLGPPHRVRRDQHGPVGRRGVRRDRRGYGVPDHRLRGGGVTGRIGHFLLRLKRAFMLRVF